MLKDKMVEIMSKYSVNEPELQHAIQLLNGMEAEFSSLRQRVIHTRNSLYGQQGYGVSEVCNELDLQEAMQKGSF